MIAILGTGKMGEALLSGLLRAGRPPEAVVAAVRREDRAVELHGRYGIQVTDAASAAKLADTGARMRVYVPYGGDWYAYLVRRLAERPRNLAFFLRSLRSGG